MINKFTNKKILIAVTLIFLNNCSANTYSNFDNNNSRNNVDFLKKNSYVSCGSSSYYLYNNYSIKIQNIILDAKILGKIKKNMGITIQIVKNGSTITQKNEHKFSSI